MGIEQVKRFIDMPESLINSYQYYTQVVKDHYRETVCQIIFSSQEGSVSNYIVNY